MQGTMLWFNEVKDVGVITTDDGDRFPVHGTGFRNGDKPKGRCAGTVVSFRLAGTDGDARAVDVSLVAEIAPRRARLRHGRYRQG